MARGLVKDDGAKSSPPELLELFSMEGCGSCRRVREVLTELDLDFLHRSCPKGESEGRRTLEARGGRVQVPYLIDPNQGVELYESKAIIAYLYTHYR
jgi:glutathione S-transferase